MSKRIFVAFIAAVMAFSALAFKIEAKADTGYYEKVSEMISSSWSDDHFEAMALSVGSKSLTVDGKSFEIDPGRDTAPVIVESRTLLPIRTVVELIGGTVGWNGSTQTVTLSDSETTIEMVIGSKTAKVNGKTMTMDVAPAIINERTMLPVRAVAESFGLSVSWEPATQTTTLTRDLQTKRLVAVPKASYDFGKFGATLAQAQGMPTVLQFSTMGEAKAAYDEMLASGAFEYVEPDYFVSANTEFGATSVSWGVDRIHAAEFAEGLIKQGKNPALKVAVLDTGLDTTHQFLAGRYTLTGSVNTITGGTDITDSNGHGTHVSGVIVECTPGMNLTILPIKVLGNDGYGTDLSVATGILKAIDAGVDIINLSLTGSKSSVMDDAIRKAVAAGVTVVGASGYGPSDASTRSPGNVAEAIIVTAVDQSDAYSSTFSSGSSVDFASPGVNISSSIPGNKYGTAIKSSGAMSHATAAVALLLAEDPSRSPAQVDARLRQLVDDRGPTG
jgi:hypothetical protein